MASHLPVFPSVYKDPDVLKANPWFADALPVVESAKSRPVSAQYPQVSDVIRSNMNAYLAGTKTTDVGAGRHEEPAGAAVPLSRLTRRSAARLCAACARAPLPVPASHERRARHAAQGPVRARARRGAARAGGAAAARHRRLSDRARCSGTACTRSTTTNPRRARRSSGFANYLRAFDDERFWHSTWNTVLYIVVTVPGALRAWASASRCSPTSRSRVKWPVRLGLLLPWALPLVFAGLIFRWFFEYNTGVVNNWLVGARHRAAAVAVAARRSRSRRSASRSSGRRRRSWR